MDVGRGLTNLRVELGISAKHEYGLKYFVSDIMCGARTKKTWDFYNTKRYKHGASSEGPSSARLLSDRCTSLETSSFVHSIVGSVIKHR